MNLQNSYAVEFLQKLEEQFIDLDSVDSLLKQLIHDIPNGKPRFLSSEISSILYSFFIHIIDVYVVPKLNRQTLPIGIKRRDNLRRNPSNNSITRGLALQRPISNDVLNGFLELLNRVHVKLTLMFVKNQEKMLLLMDLIFLVRF